MSLIPRVSKHLKDKSVHRQRSLTHDNPVAIFGSSVPAHWLPGMKLCPFLYVFSQASVIGHSQRQVCQEKWSLVRLGIAVFLKFHFILKYSGQGAHYAGKTPWFLFSWAAILFSYHFFLRGTHLVTCQHSSSHLGPFFSSLAWRVYLESKTIHRLYHFIFTSALPLCRLLITKKNKITRIQGAIKSISFFPKANISFIAGLLGGRDNM